jgi:hypothetical protein
LQHRPNFLLIPHRRRIQECPNYTQIWTIRRDPWTPIWGTCCVWWDAFLYTVDILTQCWVEYKRQRPGGLACYPLYPIGALHPYTMVMITRDILHAKYTYLSARAWNIWWSIWWWWAWFSNKNEVAALRALRHFHWLFFTIIYDNWSVI